MSTLKFVLSYNNGAESLQLPVNPERVNVSSPRGYEDIEVTQLGEYTVIGNAKLREVSFTSFFPREYNESYCEYAGFLPPWEIVKMIERWINSGKPVRFVLSGQIYGESYSEIINMPVTIREFQYHEEAGAVGDVGYDITLKEFRFVQFRRLTTTTNEDGTEEAQVDSVGPQSRPNDTEKLKEYEVKLGDNLFKIAAMAGVYDDPDKWQKLYDANKDVIGPNPNLIQPGQKLVIA